MKNLVYIFLLISISVKVMAIPTTITTQAQFNTLQFYPVIVDDIILTTLPGQDSSTMITDLSPLLGVDSIYGILKIENTALTTLYGLHNLKYLRRLEIVDNKLLVDARDLNYTGAALLLTIRYNDALEFLPTFSSLKFVGNITIEENPSIQNIEFNLDSLSVFIDPNWGSSNKAQLTIDHCKGLKSVRISEKTARLYGMRIVDNDSLIDFHLASSSDSLSSVDFVRNSVLNNITGFQSVNYIMILGLMDNTQLSNACFVQHIFMQGVQSTVILRNNAPGANSIAEVLATDCSDFNTSVPQVDKQLLDIYPNPTNELVFVNGLQQVSNYFIYSTNGQLIQSGSVGLEGKVDVSSISSGLYLIKLNDKHAKLFIE